MTTSSSRRIPAAVLSVFLVCEILSLTKASAGLITAHVTEPTGIGHPQVSTAGVSDGDADTSWYSNQANGDYFDTGAPPPVFILDLGADRTIDACSFINYYDQSMHRVTRMTMRFATQAEGTPRFDYTIPDANFEPSLDKLTGETELIPLDRPVHARYVELTLNDNLGGHSVGFADIRFNVISPFVTVTATGAIEVEEQGRTSDLFQLALAAPPARPVTITLDPKTDELRLGAGRPGAPRQLKFTPANWQQPQPVEVRAAEDAVLEDAAVDGRKAAGITLSSTSADPAFNDQVLAPVWVAIVDQGITSANDDTPVTFTDVTAALGLDGVGGGQACWVDFDNDGWTDLAAGELWRNEGGRRFVRVGPDHGNSWGDIDNDGFLDVFGAGGTVHFGSAEGAFTTVSLPDKVNENSEGGALLDIDGDGLLDIYWAGWELQIGANQHDGIYKNMGDRTFQRIWKSGQALPARGTTAADFDNDGDTDIYVSNYRLCGNCLWRNETITPEGSGSPGTFAFGSDEHNALAGNGHSIGSAWGDFDNDGLIDIFAGNFAHSRQPMSRFLRNPGPAGNFRFEDKDTSGVLYQESFCSPTVGDYDNDGDLDLFFTTIYGGDAATLYRNDGGWWFRDATESAGLAGIRTTYQAAWYDFDNDGDLDLMTGGRLFRNNGNLNHWLQVRLVGSARRATPQSGAVNRSAIGAQVRLALGESTLTRQVESSTGHGNLNGHTLHFGLGGQKSPRTLEISWPYTNERQQVTAAAGRVTTVRMPAR